MCSFDTPLAICACCNVANDAATAAAAFACAPSASDGAVTVGAPFESESVRFSLVCPTTDAGVGSALSLSLFAADKTLNAPAAAAAACTEGRTMVHGEQ